MGHSQHDRSRIARKTSLEVSFSLPRPKPKAGLVKSRCGFPRAYGAGKEPLRQQPSRSRHSEGRRRELTKYFGNSCGGTNIATVLLSQDTPHDDKIPPIPPQVGHGDGPRRPNGILDLGTEWGKHTGQTKSGGPIGMCWFFLIASGEVTALEDSGLGLLYAKFRVVTVPPTKEYRQTTPVHEKPVTYVFRCDPLTQTFVSPVPKTGPSSNPVNFNVGPRVRLPEIDLGTTICQKNLTKAEL